MNPQNPLGQIAAAQAALQSRVVAMYYIPSDERLDAQQASTDGAFEDIAAIGVVTLSFGEQKQIHKRNAANRGSEMDLGTLLLAESLKAVVIGGPLVRQVANADGGVDVELADPEENPTPPTPLATSIEAMKYITRMHPKILVRALSAFADIHAGKEENTAAFLKSRRYLAG